MSLPDVNGVFWSCCASSWVTSKCCVFKALPPKSKDDFGEGFAKSHFAEENFSVPGEFELGESVLAAVKTLR